MDMLTKSVKGTQDILPNYSKKWRFLENFMITLAQIYGFKEIRTPVFEHTELFDRGIGDDTDIVQKEMYTFNDKGGRSITLKPEGTASVVRAMLENGLFNEGLPVKLAYIMPCYRYEKPQSGRLREFHQFGVEIFGPESPAADAEVICLANSLFEQINISGIHLELNSIGCPECRKNYQKALKNYLIDHKNNLCETCLTRLEKNPLRIVDCKDENCQNIVKEAPVILDFLCKNCTEHFDSVKKYLSSANINFVINPKIVRGLDYYNRTVFEFVSDLDKKHGLVCGGGGRYDGLVSEISGGMDLPAVGFGIGIERLIMLMETQNINFPSESTCDVYIATVDNFSSYKAFELSKILRQASIYTELDVMDRGLKSQMKFANKINAKFSLVLGKNEVDKNVAQIKCMETGELFNINLNHDDFLDQITKIIINHEMSKHK